MSQEGHRLEYTPGIWPMSNSAQKVNFLLRAIQKVQIFIRKLLLHGFSLVILSCVLIHE